MRTWWRRPKAGGWTVPVVWALAGVAPVLVMLAAHPTAMLFWVTGVAGLGWLFAGGELYQRCVSGERLTAASTGATVLIWWTLVTPWAGLAATRGNVLILLVILLLTLPPWLVWQPSALAMLWQARRDLLRSRRWERGPLFLSFAVLWLLVPEFTGLCFAHGDAAVMFRCIAVDVVAVGGLSLLGFALDRCRISARPAPAAR